MYLPLMARLTVVSCTPTASAICTIVIGFNCEEPQPKAEGKPRYELPVVVLVLVRFGLITYEFMARTRPYAIVLTFRPRVRFRSRASRARLSQIRRRREFRC